jgi:hypothetical protein
MKYMITKEGPEKIHIEPKEILKMELDGDEIKRSKVVVAINELREKNKPLFIGFMGLGGLGEGNNGLLKLNFSATYEKQNGKSREEQIWDYLREKKLAA